MAKGTQDPDKEELADVENQYLLRKQDDDEQERYDTADDIPAYKVKLDLTNVQKERLSSQFKEEFEALVAERAAKGLPAKWASLDRQYDGTMRKNSKLQFNLHCQQSKIKADAIVRSLNEAFLDSKPMVDISPRPEMWKQQDKNSLDVCQKQQQFIEYEVTENVQPERDLALIAMSTVKKFVGVGKIEWCYEKEKRRRFEMYEGKNETIDMGNGRSANENKALAEFVSNYPDWEEKKYNSYYRKIAEGNTVYLVVNYLDTLQNTCKLRYVALEDFYVKNSTNYNDGLRQAGLIVERQTMNWRELKKKEENDEFEDVDDLKKMAGKEKDVNSKDTYKTRDYNILEATMYFNMDKNDEEEETKIKAWFAEVDGDEEKDFKFLGAIDYPYFGFDSDYIGFWIKLNDDGFFGDAKSVMADLKDSNIAQDALMNMALHSIYIRNILTPIVKEGSEIEAAFIENRWQDGKPIVVDQMTEDVKNEVSFIQYPQINLQDFVVLDSGFKKQDGDVTGVSGLMTGRESPSDPHAPASKTIALLQQSGINIKDYIRNFLPSFNLFIGNMLQLYYQMSQEGRKYQIGSLSKKVTGMDAFANISRDEMIAKTNIQARAAAFAFDKVLEKQENLGAFQAFGSTPIALTQPEAYYKALKIFLKSYSPTWAAFAENDMMSNEEFEQSQAKVAVQAIMQVVQQAQMQAKATGVPPQLDLSMFTKAITQAQMMANNPKLAQEAQKQQQKGTNASS